MDHISWQACWWGCLSGFGKRNSIVWSVLCLKPEPCGPSEVEWQGELFIVCDLQSWVQLGTFSSKLLVRGTLQSRAVGLGSGAASSSSWKYFFQKSPEALLLRPAEDMCSPSTCQGKGTVEISGVWLGGCPCCMFYLVQDIRWHPSWKEAGGSMEGSKVFWNPGGLRWLLLWPFHSSHPQCRVNCVFLWWNVCHPCK